MPATSGCCHYKGYKQLAGMWCREIGTGLLWLAKTSLFPFLWPASQTHGPVSAWSMFRSPHCSSVRLTHPPAQREGTSTKATTLARSLHSSTEMVLIQHSHEQHRTIRLRRATETRQTHLLLVVIRSLLPYASAVSSVSPIRSKRPQKKTCATSASRSTTSYRDSVARASPSTSSARCSKR